MEILASFSTLLPIAIGTYCWTKITYKSFFWFLVFSTVLDFSMLILATKGINNLFLVNAYVTVRLAWLSLILVDAIPQSKLRGNLIKWLPLVLVLLILTVISYNGWNVFSFHSYLIDQLILMFLSVLVFILLIRNNFEQRIFGLEMFWILSGLIFYFSLSTVILTLFQAGVTIENNEFTNFYINFYPFVQIGSNIFFSLAFLCTSK